MALSPYTQEEFWRMYGAHERFESTLVFAWFDWRQQQDKDWMPNGDYSVEYDYKTREVVATSRFGEDRIPVEELYTKSDTEIEMQWANDWYDGPLSGVAVYNGNHVWYQVSDWSHDNLFNIWIYRVYELSEEQYQDELHWHNRFLNEVKNFLIFKIKC